VGPDSITLIKEENHKKVRGTARKEGKRERGKNNCDLFGKLLNNGKKTPDLSQSTYS